MKLIPLLIAAIAPKAPVFDVGTGPSMPWFQARMAKVHVKEKDVSDGSCRCLSVYMHSQFEAPPPRKVALFARTQSTVIMGGDVSVGHMGPLIRGGIPAMVEGWKLLAELEVGHDQLETSWVGGCDRDLWIAAWIFEIHEERWRQVGVRIRHLPTEGKTHRFAGKAGRSGRFRLDLQRLEEGCPG